MKSWQICLNVALGSGAPSRMPERVNDGLSRYNGVVPNSEQHTNRRDALVSGSIQEKLYRALDGHARPTPRVASTNGKRRAHSGLIQISRDREPWRDSSSHEMRDKRPAPRTVQSGVFVNRANVESRADILARVVNSRTRGRIQTALHGD